MPQADELKRKDKIRKAAETELHKLKKIVLGPIRNDAETLLGSAKIRPNTNARRHLDGDRYWNAQGLLWIAFVFAGGIALHRYLPDEPSWIAVTALLAFLAASAVHRGIRRGMARWQIPVLAMLGGLCCATVRTAAVDAPRLAEEMNISFSGTVERLERRVNNDRLVIRLAQVEEAAVENLSFPKRIRVRLTKDAEVAVGDRISGRARLFPPAGPVAPGAYDYSFRAFFDGIGATGFMFGAPVVMPPDDAKVALVFSRLQNNLRETFAEGIRRHLGQTPEAALAAALLVGDRSDVSEEEEEALRGSGLAHILAISGLHMALFAGGAYAASLALLALFSDVTLRWPTHKWAALIALASAGFYLFLSGASVATQRSFLMIALVFLGIVVGRRGLTLRSVAIAGLVLLMIAPERLFFPGFQMSFAAVIALVAVYELWRRARAGHDLGISEGSSASRVVVRLSGWCLGLLVTAVVAGAVTGIIGAHHFSRIAPFGVLGNLAGMPVFSLLVMPMGVLTLVLFPFGLAAVPLHIMAFAIGIVLEIARFVSGLGAGADYIQSLPALSAALLLAAVFAGLLLPGKWRMAALPVLLLALLLMRFERPPDIQIPARDYGIAARDSAGVLRLSSGRKTFANEIWLQREGEGGMAIKSRKMESHQRRCDEEGCILRAFAPEAGHSNAAQPILIAQPKTLPAAIEDCHRVDIIVTDIIVPKNCAAGLVLDRKKRMETGAVSIWLDAPALPERDGPGELAGGNTKADEHKIIIHSAVFAFPQRRRPWHKEGNVTRQSLRKQLKD